MTRAYNNAHYCSLASCISLLGRPTNSILQTKSKACIYVWALKHVRILHDLCYPWLCAFDLHSVHHVPASLHLHLHMPGKEKLAVLRDAWEQCEGEWKRSALYKRFVGKNTTTQHGARVWLTRAQVAKKYESQSMADKICNAKLQDAETKEKNTKEHPDCPGDEAGEAVVLLGGWNWLFVHPFFVMIIVISCISWLVQVQHSIKNNMRIRSTIALVSSCCCFWDLLVGWWVWSFQGWSVW